MAEEKLNIYQKIAKVRQMVEVLLRDKAGYNYRYTSDAQILAKVTAGMKKYGLLLIPSIVPGTLRVVPQEYRKNKFTKDGEQYTDITNEVIVYADTIQKWVNIDNPEETIEVPWAIVGSQSDPSMSLGGSLTFSRRYYLIHFFSSSTVDGDVDAWRSEQKAAEQMEGAEIAKSITAQIDAIYAKNADVVSKKKEFEAELRKVILINGKPSANWKLIKDPAMAAQALAVTKKVFEVKDEE
mgnify:CR=1 FL=1|jgi:hypothetical protein